MKQFLIILFFLLLFLSSCSPKYLQGTYQTYVPEGKLSFVQETYHFTSDGSFTFEFLSDNISSNSYGEGKYILKGNRLVLNFEDIDEAAKAPTYEDFYGEAFPSDSTTIILNFKHENDLPVQAMMVYFFKGVKEERPPVFTDKNGTARFTIAKNSIPFRIETHALGSTPFSYTFSDEFTWRLDVTLGTFFGKIYSTEDPPTIYKIQLKENDLWLKQADRRPRLLRQE